MRDQRARLSHDAGRRSMFAETSNLWESKYLRDIRERKSRVSLSEELVIKQKMQIYLHCIMMLICVNSPEREVALLMIGGSARVHLKSLKLS